MSIETVKYKKLGVIHTFPCLVSKLKWVDSPLHVRGNNVFYNFVKDLHAQRCEGYRSKIIELFGGGVFGIIMEDFHRSGTRLQLSDI